MSFIVGKIPGEMRIDPDAGGQGQQRKRGMPAHKAGGRDSVCISEEARERSISERDVEQAE